MWVIFEGLDKSGKGTLEKEFLKATNYKHIVIDRGPAGYLTFDQIFDRVTDEGNIQFAKNLTLMKASGDFIVAYCKVPVDVAKQRLEEHNETCPYDYEQAQNYYDLMIDSLYRNQKIKVIDVDTTKSIKECVDLIIEKFEEAK